jgi:hypothetical protein
MNDPSGGPIHVELPVSGAKRTTFSRTRSRPGHGVVFTTIYEGFS